MKKILIPLIILGIAVLTYIVFLGRGEFMLPTKEMISHDLKVTYATPVSSRTPFPDFTKNKLTLESIFKNEHHLPQSNGLPVVTLIATGDVIPARSVNYQSVIRHDFKWPFLKVADELKKADITFINLESPLIKNCPITQEGMNFCGDERNVEGLNFAGVDVVSLANNHSANKGKIGIDETVAGLTKAGIKTTGIKGATYLEVKGVKFAFLGYNDVEKTVLNSSAEEETIKKEVADAKRQSDVVVVAFHWGQEYVSQPDKRQQMLAHLTIDSGADLVIGNHPHWIKPVEIYHDQLIAYGHGNFVFDQEWSQKTKEGAPGRYTFVGKNLVDVEYLPVEIVNYGQPYFLEGLSKQKILNDMYDESVKLSKNRS